VVFGADAVEAQHLAGHLEASDLIAPVFEDHIRLERARANRVNGLEGVAGTVKMLLPLDFAAATDELIELVDLTRIEAERKTQFPQVALGTGRLDLHHRHRHYRFHLHA
jgi:hypothetical protein